MFTDMVGYAALGQKDEPLSLALVEETKRLLRPIFSRHGGKEVKMMGDAFLVEFSNALDAVRCAYDIQRGSREFNISMPAEKRLKLRVGVHLGDVVESDGDIFGDAVNVASRIEPLAAEGGICLTQQVYDQVQNKFELSLVSQGKKMLKNVATPLEVYRVVLPWENETLVKDQALETLRIAVLPFVSLSPDPQDEFFADGLTEELIDRLCQVRELEVIARTSVMSYKGKEKKAAEIGKELRAGMLVEGSVRKAGNKIRVTAQLINASTEGHLWSSRYDRNLEDIFVVQSDIAEQVADALRVRLLPSEKKSIEKKPTESTQAYTLYLKGRYYWNERTEDGLVKAITYLEQAVEMDPKYALAYALLSDSHGLLANYGYVQSKEALPLARKYAEKALRLDDTLADAHTALASVLWDEWKLEESMVEQERAIELSPNNASAHHRYAVALMLTGKGQDAMREIRRAEELDPLSPVINASVAGGLNLLRRYDEAIKEAEESLKLIPDYYNLYQNLGLALVNASRYDEGISKLQKAVVLSGNSDSTRADLAVGYALSGRTEEATKILNDLMELSKTKYVSPVSMASVCAAEGKRDEAIQWLEKARDERSATLTYVMNDPVFMDALGDDPRFLALMAKMREG